MRSICVYCGARSGTDPHFAIAAHQFGARLAGRGLKLVYGGGHAGLMGAVADGALQHGGEVLGIIPRRLVERELGHRGIQELRVVDTMHDRKLQMAQAADAFVALPGGLGTLEELFEVWTWQQLGYHHRPIGLLDTAGFQAPLRGLLEHLAASGFVSAATVARLHIHADPDGLIDLLLADLGDLQGDRADFSPI